MKAQQLNAKEGMLTGLQVTPNKQFTGEWVGRSGNKKDPKNEG
jgi:hypothetical protein